MPTPLAPGPVTDLTRPTGGTPGTAQGRGYRAVVEWAIILVAVLICTVGLRTFVVQSFSIPSAVDVPHPAEWVTGSSSTS